MYSDNEIFAHEHNAKSLRDLKNNNARKSADKKNDRNEVIGLRHA